MRLTVCLKIRIMGNTTRLGGVKVSTGAVRYGKRVAARARYKTCNFKQ